jgi:hypothetical protein
MPQVPSKRYDATAVKLREIEINLVPFDERTPK